MNDEGKMKEQLIKDLAEANKRIAEMERSAAMHDEALRHERDLVSLIMETSPVGIMAVSREGKITFVNAGAENMLGLSRDEATGLTYNDANWHITSYDGGEFPDDELPFRRVMCSGQAVYDVRHAIERPDGRRVYLSINAAPVFTEAGGFDGIVATFEDITERKQMEEELRVNLTKYKVLFESFPLGITISDKDGNIVETNKESARLLGLSKEKHISRKIGSPQWQIIRADGTTMPTDEYASVSALKNNTLVENVEMGIIKAEDDITWINVTAAPIPLEGYGVAVTYGDITSRRHAEEALKESEHRYHDLFNGMTEGFALHEIICNEKGEPCDYRFLDINPAFERLTGLRREDVVGKIKTQVLPDDDPKWIEIYGTVALTGEPVHFENYSPALKRLYEVFSYRPAPNQFAVMFMDITQRKKAEDELRRHRDNLEELVKERTRELGTRNIQLEEEISERKKAEDALRLANTYNRSLIEASLDPLVTIDAGGKITDVNVATELVTGYARGNLIGTDFSDYFTEPEKARSGYRQVFSKGSVHDYPLEILHRDGRHTPVLYNATVYKDNSGKIIGVFAAARDITEHKRAEEEKKRLELQLIQAQKIEALGKLAGGIAHDFKNILQPILINAELISDMLPPGTQEREYVDQIIEASQLGKNLVSQIRLFSIKKDSLCKPIALGTVVHDALNFFKRSLPPDITFRQRIAAKESLVQAEPTQIHQVILNLCTNAVQAIKPGKGTLDVSLRETEIAQTTPAIISDLKPGRYVKLTVRDTGCGISPEAMDRVFDPFFTTRKSDKGTGLGLTVVHEVVKNAGGSILIHSEIGKGSSFDVFFPLHLDSPDQIHASSPLVSGKGDKHILLVDDNTADLRSIHQLLAHIGYLVTSTTDPHEALSILREEPKKFDLLITDQVMPRMRGHELATQAHEIRKDLPVIICSGSEEAIQELQKHQADIHDYIHKPFSKDQLIDALQRALN